jgi:hypothetical protein
VKWNDPAIPARLVKQLCRVRHLFGQGAYEALLARATVSAPVSPKQTVKHA